MFKPYYTLTKPGIIYGNILTAGAGFLLASHGHPELLRLGLTLTGIALVIASACVFNNYLDRDIDRQMQRTKNRALVTGEISPSRALTYGAILGVAGFTILAGFTNTITFAIGVIGFVSYVVIYTYAKRITPYGTLLGSISGSTSLVAGYCAVTNSFDLGAAILFLIMAIWQMPHFYAIAAYRLRDYADASIPVLPVSKGMKLTKRHITLYIAAFIGATALLTAFGYTGYIYLIVMLVLGLGWLRLALKGFGAVDDTKWAQHVFRYSLVVLMTLSLVMSANSFLV